MKVTVTVSVAFTAERFHQSASRHDKEKKFFDRKDKFALRHLLTVHIHQRKLVHSGEEFCNCQ